MVVNLDIEPVEAPEEVLWKEATHKPGKWAVRQCEQMIKDQPWTPFSKRRTGVHKLGGELLLRSYGQKQASANIAAATEANVTGQPALANSPNR